MLTFLILRFYDTAIEGISPDSYLVVIEGWVEVVLSIYGLGCVKATL